MPTFPTRETTLLARMISLESLSITDQKFNFDQLLVGKVGMPPLLR